MKTRDLFTMKLSLAVWPHKNNKTAQAGVEPLIATPLYFVLMLSQEPQHGDTEETEEIVTFPNASQ